MAALWSMESKCPMTLIETDDAIDLESLSLIPSLRAVDTAIHCPPILQYVAMSGPRSNILPLPTSQFSVFGDKVVV